MTFAPSTAAAVPRHRGTRRWRDSLSALGFLAPGLIGLIVFLVLPLIASRWIHG
ncbi:MAG: hypothetical protein ACTHOR_04465 [Devosia sp.]